MTTCAHLADLEINAPPSGPGCYECMRTGGRWVHLRRCLRCGRIGCCDNSPGRHATAHFHETTHPLIQSYEPGEDWVWCYVDELFLEVEGPPSPSHP
jgi:uncharacterized UBP type Zn finger protein